jgi:hypothetical protein
MDDGKATVNGLSSTVCFAGVVARVVTATVGSVEGLGDVFKS